MEDGLDGLNGLNDSDVGHDDVTETIEWRHNLKLAASPFFNYYLDFQIHGFMTWR